MQQISENRFHSFRRGARRLAFTVVLLLISFRAMAAFTVDTATSPMTGLWWNPNESGWGMSLQQQGPIMFIGWYTYDSSGNSTRYFMSNCAVSGSGCSGEIYRVVGGAAPTAPWTGHGPVTTVGTGSLSFSDLNNATFSFTLNSVAGTKTLSRMVFGSPVAAPAIDYTALWWNPNESGWGVFVTHQGQTMFVVLFSYDAAGNPLRYVASNCVVSGNGCSGTLYKTSGGSAPTVPWAGPIVQTAVGSLSLSFSDASNGSLNVTIDNQPGTKSISKLIFYTPPATPQNVVPIVLDDGPIDSSGNPLGFINMPYISVTICKPGSTTQCQTIDHVDVDTGSSGMRILSSVLSSSLGLSPVVDAQGNPLAECLRFVDGYTWGSLKQADIRIGGELAPNMSIQIVGDNVFPNVPSGCSNGLISENTVASFGANGLIGISVNKEDCGLSCENAAPAGAYYVCPNGVCKSTTVPRAKQVNNPVASFAVNNNGTLIQLPAIGASGVPTVTGSLIFGIGTQSNNSLGSAIVYTTDPVGLFSTTYKGKTFTQSFIDSGSNGFFFSDSSIPKCSFATDFYCPASTLNLTAVNIGKNGANGQVNFSIANLGALDFRNNAFSNIGGSFNSISMFDWGLPFFFGRSVYTAIEGMNAGGTVGPYIAY